LTDRSLISCASPGTFITRVRDERGPVRLASGEAVFLNDGDQITCVLLKANGCFFILIGSHYWSASRFANELAFVVFCQQAAGAALLNTLPLIQQQQQNQERVHEGNTPFNVASAAAVSGSDAAVVSTTARTQSDLQALRTQLDLHHQTNHLQLQVLQQQHEISLADLNQKLDAVAGQLQQQQVLLLAYQQQAQQQQAQQQQAQQQPVLLGGIGATLNFDHAELVLVESLTPGMYANLLWLLL
jgi:hypothetical protein